MIDSSGIISAKLEELYRVLSENELRNLGRYLASPFLVRDKSLLSFHQFLCQNHPGSANYNKHSAWKAFAGKESFNEKKFRYKISDMVAAIEDFIYAGQIMEQKADYTKVLNEYFTAKEATLNKNSLGNRAIQKARSTPHVVAPGYYLQQHFEQELLVELHTTSLKTYRKYVSDLKREEPGNLEVFYVIEKLRQMCLAVNDNNVLGLHTTSFYADEILKLARNKEMSGYIFIAAYRQVYELLTQKTENSYYALKQLIHDSGFEIDEKTVSELLVYARNYCIARVNAGNVNFFDELFELYREGLDKGGILINGEISERNFKNIVTTALRTGKYDWTLDFINEYRAKLNKRVRENAFNYNMANYLFHAHKYDKVLQNLQKVQLADLFYGLDARSLMIKCYYELDEKEAFMNAYYSFRIFVQRRKNVSEQHRRNYLNFLRIAKKLMNLRVGNKNAIQKLQQEITNAKAIADKQWLEEKLKERTGVGL